MQEKGWEMLTKTKICCRKRARNGVLNEFLLQEKRAGNGDLKKDLLQEKGRETAT
jgi:hypothetical protein